MVIERMRSQDERIRLSRGKQRLKGGSGGLREGGKEGRREDAGCDECPRLLSLLDACVRAGDVEEFQGSGSSG